MDDEESVEQIRDDAKDLKHQGWIKESQGQLVKVAGQLTNDPETEQEGAERQAQGNLEKHVGKLVEDQTKI